MRHAAAFVVLISLLASATARSQGGQGANAQAPEALTLLRSGLRGASGGQPPRIEPGLPEGFPGELLPEGAVPVISTVTDTERVAVVSLPSGTKFERVRFNWKLEDAGWMSNGPMSFGFTGMGGEQLGVCRAQDFANYMFRTAQNGDQLIRIAIRKESLRSCAPIGFNAFRDVPIPVLVPPPGLRTTGGGGGGGMDEHSSRTRFETVGAPMPLDAIANHFTQQFVEQGWKVEGKPFNDENISVTRFSGVSRAGDPVTGQLILTALAGTPYIDGLARFIRNKPVRVR